jgi:phage shock protein C
MTSPYSSNAPKRLERSKSSRVIAGVCGGLANYLNMDPNLVRVLTVLISLFTGVPIVAYIVLAFVLPEEGSESTPSYPPVRGAESQQQAAGSWGSTYASDTSAGGSTTAEPVSDPVWGPTGAPWEQPTAAQPAATQSTFPTQPMTEQSQPWSQPTGQQATSEPTTEPGPEPGTEVAGGEASDASGTSESGTSVAGDTERTEATVPIETDPNRTPATGQDQGKQA